MNDRQLKNLQHNLTRSAKKAKKYWVRGMVGYTESDQGFFPLTDIPVVNPFRNKETTLSKFIMDTNAFHTNLEGKNNSLENKLLEAKAIINSSVERINKLEEEVADLQKQIKELVTFNLG